MSATTQRNIGRLLDLTGITHEQLGEIANVTRSAVSQWVRGGSEPRMGAIQRISDHFGIRKACIIEDGGMDFVRVNQYGQLYEDVEAAIDSQMVEVPLYGSIAAGKPIDMLEMEGTILIPRPVRKRFPEAFLLKIEGESMNIMFPDGCYVLVDPCKEVERNGKPYAICVNGYSATVKCVRRLANGFELVPVSTDPTFKSTLYDYGVEGTDEITVIGRVVWDTKPYDWEY